MSLEEYRLIKYKINICSRSKNETKKHIRLAQNYKNFIGKK